MKSKLSLKSPMSSCLGELHFRETIIWYVEIRKNKILILYNFCKIQTRSSMKATQKYWCSQFFCGESKNILSSTLGFFLFYAKCWYIEERMVYVLRSAWQEYAVRPLTVNKDGTSLTRNMYLHILRDGKFSIFFLVATLFCEYCF